MTGNSANSIKGLKNKAMMVKLISFFMLAGLLLPCPSFASPFSETMDQLVSQMASGFGDAEKRRVAVIDFVDLDGEVNSVGKYLAEEVMTRLSKLENIQVIERRLLKKVMAEMKLQSSGLADGNSAARLGKLLGVDSLCSGTLTELQRSVKINARMIDVETGRVISTASAEIDRNILPSVWMLERPEKPKPRYKPRYTRGFSYLRNGGFLQGYDFWQRAIGDVTQGYSQAEIIPFSYGKSGKALHMRHKGKGHLQFAQVVKVPGPDLIFSASFQTASREGPIMGFSGTGVVQIALQYFDEHGTKIGETIIVNYVKNLFADTALIGVPRRSGDSYKTHFIEISQGRFHQDYRLDILGEIQNNLLGLDPSDVRKIAVIVWCGATESQASGELWVTDMSLNAR